jgi:hypothetical protein
MKETLSTISSYSGLLPLVAGVFFWRYRKFRPFLMFLIVGIANDLVISFTTDNAIANFSMSVYSLFDILFLLWFSTRIYSIFSPWKVVVALLIFLIWFGTYNMFEPWQTDFSLNSRYFDPILLTVVALTAAMGLIKIIESPHKTEWQMYFGFYVGIFIYNFSVFFTHAFIGDAIAKELWYINAIFNIIAMLIYTWAFLRLRHVEKNTIN